MNKCELLQREICLCWISKITERAPITSSSYPVFKDKVELGEKDGESVRKGRTIIDPVKLRCLALFTASAFSISFEDVARVYLNRLWS